MSWTATKRSKLGCVCAAAIALGTTGCATDQTRAPEESALVTLQGVVIDGYVAGAHVFLDLNDNQTWDADEPRSVTGDDGAFALDTGGLSREQVRDALLVAEVPEDARDADDQGLTLAEAGRGSFTLLSPTDSFSSDAVLSGTVSDAVISPLTTLVADEMLQSDSSSDEAEESVAEKLGLKDKDLLGDFVKTPDAVLHNVARATALSLGEAARSIPRTADEDTDAGPRGQRVVEAIRQVRAQLPELLDTLALHREATPAASVERVRSAWAEQMERRGAEVEDAGTAEDAGAADAVRGSQRPEHDGGNNRRRNGGTGAEPTDEDGSTEAAEDAPDAGTTEEPGRGGRRAPNEKRP